MDGSAHRAGVGHFGRHTRTLAVGRRFGGRLLAHLEGVAGSVQEHAQVGAQLLGELRLLGDVHHGAVGGDLVALVRQLALEGEDVLLLHDLHRVPLGGIRYADDHRLGLRAEAEVPRVEDDPVGGRVRPPGVGQLGHRGEHRCALGRFVALARRLELLQVDASDLQLLAQPEAQARRLLEQLGRRRVDGVLAGEVDLLDVHRVVHVATEHLLHRVPLGGVFDGHDDRREVVPLAPAEAETDGDAVDLDLAAGGGEDLGDAVQLRRFAPHAGQLLQSVQLQLDLAPLRLGVVLLPGLDGLVLRQERLEHQLVVQRFVVADLALLERLRQEPEGHVVPLARRLDRRARLRVLVAQHGAAFQVLDGEDGLEDVIFAGDAGEHALHGVDQLGAVQLLACAVGRGAVTGVTTLGARDASAPGDTVVTTQGVTTTVAGPGTVFVAHGNLSSRRLAAKVDFRFLSMSNYRIAIAGSPKTYYTPFVYFVNTSCLSL